MLVDEIDEKTVSTSYEDVSRFGIGLRAAQKFGVGYCRRGVLAGSVVVPLTEADGRIAAWAFRKTENRGGSLAKLWPSPDSASKILFGSREALKRPAHLPLVIVRDVFDAIALWQCGVQGSVAILGDKLTQWQDGRLGECIWPGSRVVVLYRGQDTDFFSCGRIAMAVAKRSAVELLRAKDFCPSAYLADV